MERIHDMQALRKGIAAGSFLLFGLGWIASSSRGFAQPETSTTVFLVRHAEKADDGTFDPPLTDKGRARAEELAFILKYVKLDAIFSTLYLRNRQTVGPTAESQGLKVTIYDPEDDRFLDEALRSFAGGNILICGHSNTIPDLANRLAGEERFPDLEDWEYDALFVAVVSSGGEASVIRMHFGALSRPDKRCGTAPGP